MRRQSVPKKMERRKVSPVESYHWHRCFVFNFDRSNCTMDDCWDRSWESEEIRNIVGQLCTLGRTTNNPPMITCLTLPMAQGTQRIEYYDSLLKSRSFNNIWNPGQTWACFRLAKGREKDRTTLTNPSLQGTFESGTLRPSVDEPWSGATGDEGGIYLSYKLRPRRPRENW